MDKEYEQALNSRFPPELRNMPFRSDLEYLEELKGLCSLYLVVFTALIQEAREQDYMSAHLSGICMNHNDSMLYMENYPSKALFVQEETKEIIYAAYERINTRLEATRKEQIPLHIEYLRQLVTMSDFTFFCFICGLACELDRGFESLFVTLHGISSNTGATLGVVASIFSLASAIDEESFEDIQNPASVLNRLIFLPDRDSSTMNYSIQLRRTVVGFVTGNQYLSSKLALHSSFSVPNYDRELLFLEGIVQKVSTEIAAMLERSMARVCLLSGDLGCGKKITLEEVSGKSGVDILFVDVDNINETDPVELSAELLSLALLERYLLCFIAREPLESPIIKLALSEFKRYNLGVFIITERQRRNFNAEGYYVSQIKYPSLDLGESKMAWEHFAGLYGVEHRVDLTLQASKFALSAGQIKSAIRHTVERARTGGISVTDSLLSEGILSENTGRLSEIADNIEIFYSWDDLVLEEATKEMLREACNRIKYRHKVQIDWGFSKKTAYGNGISVLLYGPPGTGKTMCAQVLAGELGLPIYRINLSQIISKYIGETAKNLDQIFREAKSSNVILFFDEADALFAKRTEVKSSNDRHANSESSYLLQKIEEYTGVCILATNLVNNFDEAFRRRINYMINIHMPSVSQRLMLWRQAFPESAPISDDVNFEGLAENLELSGSVIKSAAIQAAYYAVEDTGVITINNIVKAIRAELKKLGKGEPHFLSMYDKL